ncbi:peptide MFS transporter [Actinomycetes bacterium NPDC127524]
METTIKKEADKQQESRKKHPAGLYMLFATEAWERFSYYGMRAILVLYLTATATNGGLGVDKSTAMSIYGLLTGAVYITPMIGGYLTDKFLGRRIAIPIGGVLMALGNFMLFVNQSMTALYIGLIIMIIGNGFFKPNISTLVGDLYGKDDPRRDGAFTIFYMGINVGAFFAPLVVGLMSYKYGFLTAAIGMIVGQVIFNLSANRFLGDIGKEPTCKQQPAASVQKPAAVLTKKEKRRTVAIVILSLFVIAFWAAFEQAGSSLTLYAQDQIDRNVFGFEIPTAWFQSLNPLFIVILAPVLSAVWYKLGSSKRGDFKTPTKMGMGLVVVGLGFMVLLPAVMYTGNDNSLKVNLMFMVVTYFLHTLAELMISPVGLSMVSKIAPLKLASLLMGVWLASSAVANFVAGQLAAFTQSLGYLEIFSTIGFVTIGLGIVLLLLTKPITKLME